MASHSQQAETGDPSSLLNTGKAMPGVPCPVLGIPAQEMDTLERVQQRMIKALEHLTYEERLRELKLFVSEERRLREIFSMYTLGEGAKRTEPGSFLRCPVTGSEAMGTNQKPRGSSEYQETLVL